MRLAIIGYGKMGKSIETIAKQRAFTISKIIGKHNQDELKQINSSNTDVAIEFSTPETAYTNILSLLKSDIPVVSGTTGWHADMNDIIQFTRSNQKTFFYASNFSYSLYLFNQLQTELAAIMNGFNEYDVSITEIHHTGKKDKPSGTAITLADNIIKKLDRKTSWVCDTTPKENELLIRSERIPGVPGTHNIHYVSELDEIMLQHKARDRKIFAFGALDATVFILGKIGYFTMRDLVESRLS